MRLIVFYFLLADAMASVRSHGVDSSWDGSRSPVERTSEASSATDEADNFSAVKNTLHGPLIAHAVLGSAAWAFFFPLGGVLLRLNINHPAMLKLHGMIQMFAYILYVASAVLGIWLAVQIQSNVDVWTDPHIIIGLVILAFATLQPILGQVHHRIYRSRAIVFATTHRGPRPGRTIWSRVHVWLGRALVTLGIINGGLGLQMMEGSPVQDAEVTRNAEIGYGVAAGLVWSVYVFITSIWEGKKSSQKRKSVIDPRSRTRQIEKMEMTSSSTSSSGDSSPRMTEVRGPN